MRFYGELTQAEMAQAWEQKVSRHVISRGLKKINFTQKKTYGYQEKDEQLRSSFRLDIQQKDSNNLIHLDKSGIDNQDTYDYVWNEKGERR